MSYEVAPNGINIGNPEDQIPTGVDLEDYAAKVTLMPYYKELKHDEQVLESFLTHNLQCGCGACKMEAQRFVDSYQDKYTVPLEP